MPNILTDNHPVKVKQNRTIGELHAQGLSLRDISSQVGIPHRTVLDRLNTSEECQNIIDQTRKEHALMLPKARTRHDTLLDSKDEKIALSAIDLTYKANRITQTHTGDQYFIQTNIGNDSMRAFMGIEQDAEFEDVIEV